MSLFVGNVSRNVSHKDLKKEFSRYGECRIDLRGSFAFIEFDTEIEAEEAKDHLQGCNLGGLKLNIEWSKKSKKFEGGGRRDNGRRRSRSNSRDRRNHRRRDSRDRRSRSRSRERHRSRSRSSPRMERRTPTYSPIKMNSDSE